MAYYERNLPHWQPDGCAIFLTWRLYGSLPESVMADLRRNKKRSGRQFARAEQLLDKVAFGPAWLRDEQLARLVERSLFRGADELNQYALLSYVIMPNHVHMLIQPHASLARITKGIKGATARSANLQLGRVGRPFWQAESFDHWVRTESESKKICGYIENNPVKAGLVERAEQWPWSSAGQK